MITKLMEASADKEKSIALQLVGWTMSRIANSKYGIKELSAIFDSGMLLPYL